MPDLFPAWSSPLRSSIHGIAVATGDYAYRPGMRSLVVGTAMVLLVSGCGGDSTDGPEASTTVTVTADPEPSESMSSAPSPTEKLAETDPFAPNVGSRALRVGETREGEEVRTTVYEYKDSMEHPTNPYIEPGAGNRWVGVNAEQCARKSSSRAASVTGFSFAVADRAGGLYDTEGSSWDDWPPLPQFPFERKLQPGQCARGWMLMQVPARTKLISVQAGDFLGSGEVVADWRIR